jgi:hypothetical protein
MQRQTRDDELLSRIARFDPAAGIAPLSDGALDRVVRQAMTPAPRTWTWARFQLATFGALVGSSVLVIAAIVGIDAAAPSLPVIALSDASSPNARTIPYLDYQFAADKSLPSSAGSATAYQLTSNENPVAAASSLASGLQVPGMVTTSSDGYAHVGPSSGTNVSAWTSNGVVNWSYVAGSPGATDPGGGTGATGSTRSTGRTGSTGTIGALESTVPAGAHDGAGANGSTGSTGPPGSTGASGPAGAGTSGVSGLPTSLQASQQAVSVLNELGINSDLGTPQIDVSNSEVDVTVPLVIDGESSDQSYVLAYGANDELERASGILAAAIPKSAYPTIAPSEVVSILNDDHGFIFYGGIAPLTGLAPPSRATPTTSGSTPPVTSRSSFGTGALGQIGLTPTTLPPATGVTSTTLLSGPPVVDVDINAASMVLGTYTLANGTTWLLPTWDVSGPETGTTITAAVTYAAKVIAVESQYVHLQSQPVIF